MAKRSAGVLLYRFASGGLEVFLVHPGGPFWARKDEGAWSIPKGEIGEGEEAESAAKREFEEETGVVLRGDLTPLGAFKQPSGKIVVAFALEGDAEPSRVKSNDCRIEWPPRSGRTIDIPEIDRAGWFAPQEAAVRIARGQRPILEALAGGLSGRCIRTGRRGLGAGRPAFDALVAQSPGVTVHVKIRRRGRVEAVGPGEGRQP
jgi:predicted NUDIX family NTP pyrophosphohydrolase